ncbi:MAG TPA: RrF2 family transcriptional regulator [Gemmatimonadales bacterium]
MLSNTAEYALRAVLHLAERSGGEPVRVSEIAEGVGVPRNYLSKIFHVLARAGILRSTRGQHGGFQLAMAPDQISLAAVVGQFTDVSGPRSCLLGRPSCSDGTPCQAHARWKPLSQELATFFEETTVADLITDRRHNPAAA